MSRSPAFRERLTVQRLATVDTDDLGARIQRWHDTGIIRATLSARPRGRSTFAGQDAAPVHYVVQVRPNRDLAAGDRLLWRGRILSVTAVEPFDLCRRVQQIEAIEEPGR